MATLGIIGISTIVSRTPSFNGKPFLLTENKIAPNSGNPTWEHHLQTYGEGVVYDDFIANFTASAWNPDEWTDLFSNAGAKYFVFVTKHHDGFALVRVRAPGIVRVSISF